MNFSLQRSLVIPRLLMWITLACLPQLVSAEHRVASEGYALVQKLYTSDRSWIEFDWKVAGADSSQPVTVSLEQIQGLNSSNSIKPGDTLHLLRWLVSRETAALPSEEHWQLLAIKPASALLMSPLSPGYRPPRCENQ